MKRPSAAGAVFSVRLDHTFDARKMLGECANIPAGPTALRCFGFDLSTVIVRGLGQQLEIPQVQHALITQDDAASFRASAETGVVGKFQKLVELVYLGLFLSQ
jgi:hypothetical protein